MPSTTKNSKQAKRFNLSEIVNFEQYSKKIGDLNSKMLQLIKNLNSGVDPYDTIREYVDLIQEENFDPFIRFVKENYYK